MSLEHELRLARLHMPELDRSIFGSGDDPLPVGGDGDREDVVLRVSGALSSLSPCAKPEVGVYTK